ncbi:uncharacterized protein LOC124818397 [Hydra vulgaris]|uniref:uncharacterized protein LOC124818397 n=1 Tax=Hydra vulgaris TaxID=6087 RepID=UPI001F5E84CF|nr:uncharacterized protein LOC124818397 [Hydra vulgaris]
MISLVLILSILFKLAYVDCQQGKLPLFGRGEQPPAIDGSWSSWNEWSSCYHNTIDKSNFFYSWVNFNLKSRNRSCNSPTPLYGGADCLGPSNRYQQCDCDNPLMLSPERISSNQITASSFLKTNPPSNIRFLNNNTGWCSESKLSFFSNTFIVIDFGYFAKVKAVEIIGNENGRVSKFRIEHSLDASNWNVVYKDEAKTINIFKGNLLPNVITRNSFKEDLVLKYLKLVPIESYNFPCLKLEAFGCIYTCGEHLIQPFGKIEAQSSVNFDQSCLWKIEVLNTTSITFNFKVFFILCKNGFLAFYDGHKSFQSSSSVYKACLSYDYEELSPIKLNYNKIWVYFVSNSSSTEDNFHIEYFSECNQEVYLNAGEPYAIESPNFPNNYFDNLNCEWHLYAPKAINKLDIIFKNFAIESSSDDSCSNDFLTFVVVEKGIETSLGPFCNSNKPNSTLNVKAEILHIVFKTDIASSDTGFSFSVKAGSVVKTTSSLLSFSNNKQNYVLTSSPIFFANNSYNRSKVKNSKGTDEWTVIIISAFSALLFLLCVFVIGHSTRRYIKGRNEMNAHCAKLMAQAEKSDKKTSKSKKAEKQLLRKTTLSKVTTKEPTFENAEKIEEISQQNEADGLVNRCTSPATLEKSTQLPLQVNVKVVNSKLDNLEESCV